MNSFAWSNGTELLSYFTTNYTVYILSLTHSPIAISLSLFFITHFSCVYCLFATLFVKVSILSHFSLFSLFSLSLSLTHTHTISLLLMAGYLMTIYIVYFEDSFSFPSINCKQKQKNFHQICKFKKTLFVARTNMCIDKFCYCLMKIKDIS